MCAVTTGLASSPELYAALEAESGSAYVLGPDLSLRYVNEGFRRFARDNGAPELAARWQTSAPIVDGLPQPLKSLFIENFTRVLERQQPWSHTYECSSPDVYRKFHMRVEALPKGEGLVVVHSLVAEAPHQHGSVPEDGLQAFTDSRGFIVQCSACGRLRRAGESQRWDWAPGLIDEKAGNVSHGICSVCDFQYYGGA